MPDSTTPKISHLLELADTIRQHALELDQFYEANDCDPPSNEAGTRRPNLPDNLIASRNVMLESMTELEPLLMEPRDYMTRRIGPENGVFMSMQAIHRLEIASKFAVGEEISFDELAERCNSGPNIGFTLKGSDIRPMLRLAIAWSIFAEPRRGFIMHTYLSESLREHHNHQWIGFLAEDIMAPFARGYEAMTKWPGSEEPNETASTLYLGKPFFETLQPPATIERFSDAMAIHASWPPIASEWLFKNLDWTPDSAPLTLVDIGGSTGKHAKEFLDRFPHMKCIVQERREVVEQVLASGDQVYSERLTFEAHDFFTPQETKADVFFLRNILHDWSDKYAVKILQALIPALEPGNRIIVNELCLKEPLDFPKVLAQRIRGFDMVMKHQFNAKERDEDEWVQLFQAADPRFKLQRIANTPPHSAFSIIEFLWE